MVVDHELVGQLADAPGLLQVGPRKQVRPQHNEHYVEDGDVHDGVGIRGWVIGLAHIYKVVVVIAYRVHCGQTHHKKDMRELVMVVKFQSAPC